MSTDPTVQPGLAPSSPQPRRPARGPSPDGVPGGLVVAAAWSWRLIVVGVAVAGLVAGLRVVSAVVVPLGVAVLLAALLMPAVRFLTRRTPVHQGAAALVVLLAAIVLVVALLALAGAQIATGATDLMDSAQEGVDQVLRWLREGPLHLSSQQLDQYVDRARAQLRGASSSWTSGLLSAGATAGHFIAGLFICLIATYFFMAQGQSMWRFLVRLLPRAAQEPTHQAFRRGWVSLGQYARTQVLVAAVDAVGIGAGALVLRLPFVLPLTVLVFLSSFVPIVGAIFSGSVAVLIALVANGPVPALGMLAIVLAVQQIETHVLQPFLMGRAVALHPLAVIAAVASGSFLLGIVGALFAVPVLALANSVVRYYGGDDTIPSLGTPPMRPLQEDPPGQRHREERRAEVTESAMRPEEAGSPPDPDDPGNPTVPGEGRPRPVDDSSGSPGGAG